MQYQSQLLENAVDEFAKLPGVGRKTALRLVLHLLRQEPERAQRLGECDQIASGCEILQVLSQYL